MIRDSPGGHRMRQEQTGHCGTFHVNSAVRLKLFIFGQVSDGQFRVMLYNITKVHCELVRHRDKLETQGNTTDKGRWRPKREVSQFGHPAHGQRRTFTQSLWKPLRKSPDPSLV